MYDQIALNQIIRKIVLSLAGKGNVADARDLQKEAKYIMQLFIRIKHSAFDLS